MRKACKLLSIVLTIAVMFVFVPVFSPPVMADTAGGLAAQIGAISGLAVSTSGNTVTVTNAVIGDAASIAATLDLNINPGVTVKWQAKLSGAVGPAATGYLINLSGGGTFEISAGSITNTGTGGTIRISGAGANVTVNDDGEVISDRSGYGILIDANNVTVNVDSGGAVMSLSNNSNAAIQVGSGSNNILDAKINVTNGGSVISYNSGYAINDGAGTGTRDNNTRITINNGIVSAGSACAIHSTGGNSVVEVMGGMVSNAAASNANPTVYMNGGSGNNVIISGGIVQNTETRATSYTIQTTGNVIVSGGEVFAAGRAINLVGENSAATVSGGTVKATGDSVSSAAICTATTAPGTVPNASVSVSGGVVSAASGYAIRVTGANSRVAVSGGEVTALGPDGIAIYADADSAALNGASSFNIIVSGGTVSATAGSGSGYAIRNNGGAGSTVTVSDTLNGMGGSGGRGGQVSILRARAAIYCPNGTVTVNGGFVFAYGTNAAAAIIAPSVVGPVHYSRGMVGVWNSAAGQIIYSQGSVTNLEWGNVGGATALQWYFNPALGSGIYYNNGLTAGFFPLAPVTVTNDYGLIFDSATGNMYQDADGSGVLYRNAGNNITNLPFNLGRDLFNPSNSAWVGSPGQLILNGFSWITTKPIALTIVGQDTTVLLNGDSTFGSTSTSGVSCGIRSNTYDMTVNTVTGGSGTLTARAADGTAADNGIDIGSRDLKISGGTFIAQGGQAVKFDGPDNVHGVSTDSQHYRWLWSVNYDGSGPYDGPGTNGDIGFSPEDPFKYFVEDKYVMFQALVPVSFTATQKGGASGMADSTEIVLVFSRPVTGLTFGDVKIINNTGDVTAAGTLTGFGNTWTIDLAGVSVEGTVDVEVDHFGDFFTDTEICPDVPVYKANLYELIVNNAAGGAISGAASGEYIEGTEISVTATQNIGYRFDNWIVSGAAISVGASGDNSNPAEFFMPAQAVELTPVFNVITPGAIQDLGLIFDSGDGNLYWDVDRDGNAGGSDNYKSEPFDPTEIWRGELWDGSPGELTLNGFSWSTTAPIALTILGNTKITLTGDNNMFESTADADSSGIKSDDAVSIDGSGSLTAKGYYGVNLSDYGTLEIDGGSLIAQGTESAIYLNAFLSDGSGSPARTNYRWTYSGSYDGGDATTGTSNVPFEYFETDHYVKFQAMRPVGFTAEQTGGRPGAADSKGIALAFYDPMTGGTADVADLTSYDIAVRDGTGSAVKGAVLTGAGDAWAISLDSVGREGTVDVEVKPFGDFFVDPGLYPDVDVYKAASSGGGRPQPAQPAGNTQQVFITEHLAYIIGYPDGTVGPERSITRAEAATIFYRLLSDATRTANSRQQSAFQDVSAGSWYNNAVSVMGNMKIFNGYPDGTFRPDGAITRAEMASIAARFAKLMNKPPVNSVSFSDISGNWAASDIVYAAGAGWVNGYPDGTYRPDQEITRAEYMTMVNRMLGRVPETAGDLLTDEMKSWPDNADPGEWYYIAVQEATNSHVPAFKDKAVPGLDCDYEYWKSMLENRDWAELE